MELLLFLRTENFPRLPRSIIPPHTSTLLIILHSFIALSSCPRISSLVGVIMFYMLQLIHVIDWLAKTIRVAFRVEHVSLFIRVGSGHLQAVGVGFSVSGSVRVATLRFSLISNMHTAQYTSQ